MKKITKNTLYVIYGAGESGERYAQKLLSNNYVVLGYLDKNKEGVSKYTGLPIQRLGHETYDKDKVVVLVSLANGNLHYSVARTLFMEGYRYVIFLPMSASIPYAIRNQITCLYNKTIQGKPMDEFLLDNIEKYIDIVYDDKDCVIQATEDKKIVWVDQEIIFSESYDNYEGDKTRLPQISKIYDNHISSRTGYFKLFEYLSGKNVAVTEYLGGYFGITSNEKSQILLREREQLYKTFQREFTKGNIQFFIDGAPEATWNEQGHFNLIGGHHRTVFLLYKGFYYCPLKISKQDYELWKNWKGFKKLKRELDIKKEMELKTPIPHPFFANISSATSNDIAPLVLPIMSFLLEGEYYKSALDISGCDGFYARLAYRAKIEKLSCFINEENVDKVNYINEMLSVDGVCVENKNILNEQKQYDVIFAMDFVITKEITVQENMIKRLDEMTRKVLVLEVSNKEVETLVANTNFNTYKFLHRRCKSGKLVDVCAFIK